MVYSLEYFAFDMILLICVYFDPNTLLECRKCKWNCWKESFYSVLI